MNNASVIIIGGGQSAIACGYFLKRANLDYLILDNQKTCGGSWLHSWNSLQLFSPAKNSSLPGWLMPDSLGDYPTKEEVLAYLCAYERKYDLNVQRPVNVTAVGKVEGGFELQTERGTFKAKVVIAASGSWQSPFIPDVEGRELFEGQQLHSAFYHTPASFHGKKVLVVGGGNSGAQLYAEISEITDAVWSTLTPPSFLPDEVDGSVLFNVATAKYNAEKEGKPFDPANYSLGNIVMVPSVKAARARGILHSAGPFHAITNTGVIWNDGTNQDFDVILWCTGFRPATAFLAPLKVTGNDHKVSTTGTRATYLPGLWLVGYGSWTGFASATLIGVGRSARNTVSEIEKYLKTIQ